MIRLDAGERIPDRLAEWARSEGVRAASIVAGIGMVRETEIGYFKDGRYEPHRFSEPLELLGLAGSIAEEAGVPSVHLHLTGSGPDHRAVGGHLLGATVAVLAEITIETFPDHRFARPLDRSRGVRVLELGKPSTG